MKNQQISDHLIYFQSYQKYWKNSYQLTEYLENNNLVNESQYANRNNSSTEKAMVNVTEQINKSIFTKVKSRYLTSIFPKPLIV